MYATSRVQERRARVEVHAAGIADALLPDSVAQVHLSIGEDANRSVLFYTNVLGAIPLETVSNCTGVFLGSVDLFLCPSEAPNAPLSAVPISIVIHVARRVDLLELGRRIRNLSLSYELDDPRCEVGGGVLRCVSPSRENIILAPREDVFTESRERLRRRWLRSTADDRPDLFQ